MPRKYLIHATLFFVTLIYGGNYTIAKYALPEHVQPFGFIAIRVIASIIIFWMIHRIRTDEKVNKKDLPLLALCGLFGVAGNQMAFFYGLSLTTPINAAVIMTVTPIVVFVVAWIAGREHMRKLKIAGLLLGALGAYLLITDDGVSWSSDTFVGNLFVLVNASSYAVYLVLVKPLMAKYKPLTVIKWVFFFGGVVAIPSGFGQVMDVSWSSLPSEAIFSLIYVVLGTTVLAYLLNAWALAYVDSSVVGAYIYLQPVLATLVAVGLKEDTLQFDEAIYSLLIMLGVYLVSRKKKRANLKTEEP